MVKDAPRANKRNKQDETSPEITQATSEKRSKRRTSHEKLSAHRVLKRDAKRDKRTKHEGICNKAASPNTAVLNKEDGSGDDDDDDDVNESPPILPRETPDTKRKLQSELETRKQQ